MKRNEKILAAALGLIVVGYFAWPMIDSVFFAPIRDREDSVNRLRDQVKERQYENMQLKVAEQRILDWKRGGLPGDPLNAQRLYQQWLADLAAASGLNVTVRPLRRVPGAGVYTGIPVELKGTATFSELQVFLRRLDEVDLLHRVARVNITPPAAVEGDPELPIELVAEGLNVKGAPERPRLFAQIELTKPLPADATEIRVSSKQFPVKAGDRLRIEEEFAEVVEATDDLLRLKRGIDGTVATVHAAQTTAEHFPVDNDAGDDSIAAFSKVNSPFVKPQHYQPRFDGFADQKIVRGTPLTMVVKVADYERSAGAAPIELTEGPAGVQFDPATGELNWQPSEGLPAGDYPITLAAKIPEPQQRLEQTVTITLTEPNTAPTFEAIANAEIFLGETLRIPLTATDAEQAGMVAFTIEQGPEGASIDAATGEFLWSVPSSQSPGDVSVTVVAMDQGDPPLSAKQSFTIKVHENLKPFVRLTGVFSQGDDRLVQIWDQSSGRAMYPHEGESFEAAGLKVFVQEIGRDDSGRDFMTYERNGEIWKIELGQSLEDAVRISGPLAEVSTVDEPVEAERPGPSPAAPVGETTPAS